MACNGRVFMCEARPYAGQRFGSTAWLDPVLGDVPFKESR